MANDALTCLSFKDLDRYIHNDGSINAFGADTKEIGSLSLSDVRKRLEEDKAEVSVPSTVCVTRIMRAYVRLFLVADGRIA